jgi:outer membrane protein OmpA-like peptidoglycan-associated protein
MKEFIFSLLIVLLGISNVSYAQGNSFEWADSTFTVGAKKQIDANYFFGNYCEQDSENQSITDSLVMLLEKYPNLKIKIISHSDARGAKEANQALTLRRAKLFKDCLIERGLDGNRIFAIGKGESEPVISEEEINKFETTKEKSEAHARNRRVEIQITEI